MSKTTSHNKHNNYNLRTAEFVSPKHPDKICDQISDAILDAHLTEDPDARTAIDVAGGHGTIFITGEVTSKAKSVNISKIVRRLAGDVEIINRLTEQSPEIARGVDIGGAGDQGIMVGYACDETPELLPLECVLARDLCQHIYKKYPYDGKTQVTLKNGDWFQAVVVSWQNVPFLDLFKIVDDWVKTQKYIKYDDVVMIHPWQHGHRHVVFGANDPRGCFDIYLNPAGDWSIGGFDADSGLTGRKLAVDNYGPRIPLGGGAFSGKDPSKVDRSAAYMARRIAVDYLKARKAHEVYAYLAYAIGRAEPLESTVIIDGKREEVTGYDLTPQGIIKILDLKKPIYEQMAKHGHF